MSIGIDIDEGRIGAARVRTNLDPATLDGWIDQRGGIDAAFAALLTHPHFRDAMRAFAANTRALADADKATVCILKDVGRYLVALCVLYLHQTAGATLPRLLTIDAVRDYLSPGRVRSVLLLLEHYGYTEKVRSARRGEPARYLPTERFLAGWRAHLGAVFDATAIVAPPVAAVRDRLGDPQVFGAFCRHHTETGLMEVREEHQDMAFVRIFLHRHGGWRLLWELADSPGTNGSGPAGLSINALSNRLGVSRTHVKRLLGDGDRSGLIRYEENGTASLQDAGLVAVQFFYATQFFVFATAAQKTAAELNLGTSR